MEFQFLSIPVLLTAILLFLFTIILVKATKSKSSSASNLPPGPWRLPLIGNLHQLAVSPLVHHTLRDLANRYGPLMQLQLGELSTVVVSSSEMAREVMQTHDLIFAYRPFLLAVDLVAYNSTSIAFSPYGTYWKQLRKICVMELLNPHRVQTFRGIREEEVMNLIKSVSSDAGSPINLSRKIFSLTYGITARIAFGHKNQHQEKFISLVEEFTASAGGFSIIDVYPSIKFLEVVTGARKMYEKMHRRLDEILMAIVDEHKEREDEHERESEDLVDVLLRIQRNGEFEVPISDDNIKAVIADIFTGGSETSSSTVEWAFSEMLKNPQVMRKAQAEVRDVFGRKGNVDESGLGELKYLKQVIKETLRLHPPVPLLLPRECRQDCKISGCSIPAKTRVIVNAWAIGRDPKHWVEGERFLPDRYVDVEYDFKGSFDYIPFGAGRRVCPGISFALPNLELPLAQLLYHFDWELPGKLSHEDFDMEESFGLTLTRKNDLYLVPVPYHSSNDK